MLVDSYQPGPSVKTILVVCYSHTGYTLRVAKAIAKELNADIAVVREPRTRSGIWGYLRSGFEAVTGRMPTIHDLSKDPAEYRVVVIGTPVWASNPSSPIQAFATRYRDRFKEVALFCTMGGEGAEKTFRRLEMIVGRKACATLALIDREIDGEGFGDRVRRFSKDLLAGLAHTQ